MPDIITSINITSHKIPLKHLFVHLLQHVLFGGRTVCCHKSGQHGPSNSSPISDLWGPNLSQQHCLFNVGFVGQESEANCHWSHRTKGSMQSVWGALICGAAANRMAFDVTFQSYFERQ